MATAIAKPKRLYIPFDREENKERADSAKSVLEYRAFSRGNKGEIDLQKECKEMLRELAHLYAHNGWELGESMKEASTGYLEDTDMCGKQFFKAAIALQREYFEYLEANDLLDR